MRQVTCPLALVLCVAALAAFASAQTDTAPPVPPQRLHDMGDVVIEKGNEVAAEDADQTPATTEPAEAPAEQPTVTETMQPVEPAPAPAETPAATEPAPAETAVETPAVDSTRDLATRDIETTEVTVPAETAPAPDVSEMTSVPSIDKPHEMQVPPVRIVPGAGNEVMAVERVAVARETYRLALESLKQYYVRAGNAAKLEWVSKELAELEKIEKYNYLSELELSGPNLKPMDSIAAADQLFKEGMDFKNYPAFPDEKREKLKIAVQKFRTIISDYPTSDKIDDAAFRLGEIYEGWYYNDFARAAVAFERCFQWNPKTILPARIKAARLYDQKLMQRDKAVVLYNLVVADSPIDASRQEAAQRLTQLAPKP